MTDFFYSFKNDKVTEPMKFTDCDCEIIEVNTGTCLVKACESHTKQIRDGVLHHVSIGPPEPAEPECPLCRKYADFFMRDYESTHACYHPNHCCQCGHLHDDRKEYCDGGPECGCQTFISQEGLPAIKSKSKED